MYNWRQREDRKPVRLTVRIRTDAGWIDGTVRNVSSRGMMLHSLSPLDRNQFVEVARGPVTVVGRIVWSKDAMSGLRTQDSVDIAALIDKAPTTRRSPEQDRRAKPRPIAGAAPAMDFERRSANARLAGKAFEAVVLLAVALCGTALVASGVYGVLAAPMKEIGTVLGGSDR